MGPDDRRILALTGLHHGLVHGSVLSVPVLLVLAWRPEFSLDAFGAGLVAATAYGFFGLSSVPFGHLSDRRRPRRQLALSAGGIAASFAAVSVSPSLPALVASLAALGLFAGIYHPTGLALISRALREQGRGMGWHGMGGSLGIALGPASAGFLLGLGLPWRLVTGAFGLVAAAVLALLLEVPFPEPFLGPAQASLLAAVRGVLKGSMAWILLVYTCAGIAYWGSLTFLPALVGTASYVVLLALGAAGQVLSGRLADRARPGRLLLVLSVTAAALLAGSAIPGMPAAWILPWGFGFLLFSLEPLQNVLVTQAAPPEHRGVAFGLTFLCVFGFGSLGAVLAGYLLARGQAVVLFALLGMFLTASGAFAVVAGRRRL